MSFVDNGHNKEGHEMSTDAICPIWVSSELGDKGKQSQVRLLTRSARREFNKILRDLRYGNIQLAIDEEGHHFEHQKFRWQRFAKRFPNGELTSATFIECDLLNADLSAFNLVSTDFSGSMLVAAVFREANASNAKLPDAKCMWSQWAWATLSSALVTSVDFSGANLSNCDFSYSDLAGSKFWGADLTGANFSGANLAGCDFSGADLSNSIIGEAVLDDTNFSYAIMERCEFYPVNFVKGNYYKIRFHGASPKDWPSEPPKEGEDAFLKKLKPITRYRNHRWLLLLHLLLGRVPVVPVISK